MIFNWNIAYYKVALVFLFASFVEFKNFGGDFFSHLFDAQGAGFGFFKLLLLLLFLSFKFVLHYL